LFGAGHVGTRPAIKQDHPEWRLEVHFPDVSANLYGLLMRVTFLHYLHGELNYPSLEALKAGIDDDVQKLRDYRERTPNFLLNLNFICNTCQFRLIKLEENLHER
jgi:riboflavin kinase/FMN adenylyltransferase